MQQKFLLLVKKKRELFPGLIPMSPSSLMLPSFASDPMKETPAETHILVPEY
jgi:hypothetical protein